MDINALRVKNLRALVDACGGLTELARRLHLSGPSYLSQMLGGHRPIGEKAARKMELQMDLPAGWLDTAHDAPREVDTVQVVNAVRTVATAAKEAGVALHPARFADVVALVYEEQVRTGQPQDAYARRVVRLFKDE